MVYFEQNFVFKLINYGIVINNVMVMVNIITKLNVIIVVIIINTKFN